MLIYQGATLDAVLKTDLEGLLAGDLLLPCRDVTVD
jgi:hypothetical protein